MTNITLKRSLLAVAVAAAFGAGYAGSHAPVVAQAQAAPAVTAVPAPAMPLVRPAASPDSCAASGPAFRACRKSRACSAVRARASSLPATA